VTQDIGKRGKDNTNEHVVSKSETGGSLCGHLERDLEKATGQV
jgi:hypothetical protein